MGLEEKLTALLLTICPRSFPDFAPVDTARPYVTWQQIGGEALECLDKVVPDKRNAHVQISVWSDRRIEARDLMLQIEQALILSDQFQASPQAAMSSDFDADMDRYASQQDFTIWADR